MKCPNHIRCYEYFPLTCDAPKFEQCVDYQSYVRWKQACDVRTKERQDTETRDSVEAWAVGLDWRKVDADITGRCIGK